MENAASNPAAAPSAPEPPGTQTGGTLTANGGSSGVPKAGEKSTSDWVARVVSSLSLIVAGSALYFSTLQPAEIDLRVGEKFLVASQPRIGIPCNFLNGGARHAVITSATLKWDSPPTEFKWALTSNNLEQWVVDEKTGKMTSMPAPITPAAQPLTVKGKDQASAVFWFTSTDSNFEFTAGSHSLTLTLFEEGSAILEKKVEIFLNGSDATKLNDPHLSPGLLYGVQLTKQN